MMMMMMMMMIVLMVMLIAAVSTETVLHRLQSKPTTTLCPGEDLTVLHHLQKVDQETQTQTFKAAFSRPGRQRAVCSSCSVRHCL